MQINIDRDEQTVCLFECLSWLQALAEQHHDPVHGVAAAMMAACQSGWAEARAHVLRAARDGSPLAWAAAADAIQALRYREGFVRQ